MLIEQISGGSYLCIFIMNEGGTYGIYFMSSCIYTGFYLASKLSIAILLPMWKSKTAVIKSTNSHFGRDAV